MKGKDKVNIQRGLINTIFLSITFLSILLAFVLAIVLVKLRITVIIDLVTFFLERSDWLFVTLIILFAIFISIIWLLNRRMEQFFTKQGSVLYADIESKVFQGIDKLPVGIVHYKDGVIIWTNDFFAEPYREELLGKPIIQLFPSNVIENEATMMESDWQSYERIVCGDQTMDVYHDTKLQTIYFFDKSQEVYLEQKARNNQLVIGYIYADSPEEMQVIEDSGGVEISSEIHRILMIWSQQYNATVRKYGAYRWMIITTHEALEQMIANNMDVRKSVRKLAEDLKISVTLSGGFAEYGSNVTKMIDVIKNAVDAIELGQSRGGDQFVVYNADNPTEELIFGGDSHQKKRSSRVMARSTALALHAAIEKYDHIYITGHQFADLDAIGSMLGVQQLALSKKKQIHLILDVLKIGNEVRQLEERFQSHILPAINDPKVDIIAPYEFYPDKLPERSVVIVLDTASQKLLETVRINDAPHIIVVDHHRKGKDAVKANEIEYIDPFSSSTAELITELIQYYPLKIDVSIEIATFLLGGIILDTNKFTRNVSSRTFEAASFLRKQGAVQSYILDVLSTNIEEYLQQSNYLLTSEQVGHGGRILALDGIHSRSEIARCADFMLSFPEVKYTIVLTYTDNDGTVAMSARSKGTINMQRIMEYFKGGGHYNNAAAQIVGASMNDVVEELKQHVAIEMKKEG